MAADIYMLKTKTEQISVHFQFAPITISFESSSSFEAFDRSGNNRVATKS
jgi:hypothetical protein